MLQIIGQNALSTSRNRRQLRRREASVLWCRLARSVPIVGYGLPIAMGGAGIGFFIALPYGASLFWTPTAFLISAVLVIATGLVIDNNVLLERRKRH